MNRLMMLVCGVLVAQVMVERVAGAPLPPASKPVAATQTSEAVRVNEVDFQVVVDGVWKAPTDEKGTAVMLALKVTNRTGKAMQLNVFDTIQIRIVGGAGKDLIVNETRDRTGMPEPLVIEDGKSATVERAAVLKPMPDRPGAFGLSGGDGAGGVWHVEGMGVGRYMVRMTYENTKEGMKIVEGWPRDHAVDPKEAPFWLGKAQTKALDFWIEEKGGAASQPAKIEGAAMGKAQAVQKGREWLERYSAEKMKDTPELQFSKEDLAKEPLLAAKEGEGWRVVFANAKGNKVVIWMDAGGNVTKMRQATYGH